MVIRIILCIYLTFFGVEAMSDDFRGQDWGASRSQVKMSEKATYLAEDDDGVLYSGKVAGIDFSFSYTFLNGRLAKGFYYSDASHTNKNDYILDFEKVKLLLQKKYGAPKKEVQIWKDDHYKYNPKKWGMAVSAGHMEYISVWVTKRTTITTQLYGDEFKIKHIVTYDDTASSSEMNSIEENHALDQL